MSSCYNKENKKKLTELVKKCAKQRTTATTKLFGKDLNVQRSVEGVGKWSDVQSSSCMAVKNVKALSRTEITIKCHSRPMNKKKARTVKNRKYCVRANCVSSDSSKDSLYLGERPVASVHLKSDTELRNQSFIDCKSSSDSYYEALPFQDAVAKQKSIKYSIAALKKVNEKWTSGGSKLLLPGTHTGETDTDIKDKTSRSGAELHIIASSKNCCRLAKCLNGFSIMADRGADTSTNSSESLKGKTSPRENWRDKQSLTNKASDAFRSFSGYKMHSSFRKQQRWSSGNIGARCRYLDEEHSFPMGNSSKQTHEQSLLSAARFTSQALLQSLKKFNCDTQLHVDENKQDLMEELQDISELLKLLHNNIEELKVSNARSAKSLKQDHCKGQNSRSDPCLQQDQVTAKKAEPHENKNLISIYSVQKKTFHSGSSSSEGGHEDKHCSGPPSMICTAAKNKNELNRICDESSLQNETKLVSNQQAESKTNTTAFLPLINKTEHSVRPAVIDVSSIENLERSLNIYTNSWSAQGVLTSANALMSTPRHSLGQRRFLCCSRHCLDIFRLIARACFNLPHQRGGYAFSLMILFVLFIFILLVYINLS